MSKAASRMYRSPFREHQASATKQAIADAAERLMVVNGYDKMTIESVAREAGVSSQTVYAVFGSKSGILRELFDRVITKTRYQEIYQQAMEATDPRESLAYVATIMRQIFVSLHSVYEIIRGSTAVSPELSQVVREQEERRKDYQTEYISHLFNAGHIREDLDLDSARDVFWCLSSRDGYRLLVDGCQWSPERYEAWIVEVMADALLKPKAVCSVQACCGLDVTLDEHKTI